jgi:GT2 family glycosyltransferase
MVRASLIWLNYNSLGFMDIALKSIESVLNLDFNDYEVVIVDNASSDGSFERIRKFVEEKKPSSVRVKFVRSDVNRGYAGGMNLGWEARDPETKYVAFLNNDLIIKPGSLRKLIERMEGEEELAVVNGLIYLGDGKKVFSVGGWIDELLIGGNICDGLSVSECSDINKEHYVTYANGAYMLVKAEAVRKACPNGKPFIEETFLYLDDNLLGLILWNRGYKIKYVPVDSGVHFANMTTRGSKATYYSTRGSTAPWYLTKTKYSSLRWLWLLRRRLYRFFIDKDLNGAVKDGVRLGMKLRDTLGTLNLYCAPYIKVNWLDVIGELTLVRRYLRRRRVYAVKPADLTYDPSACR